MKMDKENVPLATEMLAELKANSKRWFTIAVVELLIIVVIIGCFVWYINQPIVETVSYDETADTQGDNSPISQNIGVE